jgi:nitrite reductase/ring-hydroxylating ferredoxin subunit
MHLVCPWHGWEYDLTTGENVADRRLLLRRYPVLIRNGDVYLVV